MQNFEYSKKTLGYFLITNKIEKFCREYLVDMNATQAAIRSGYSQATAKRIGYELMQSKPVLKRISELAQPITEKLDKHVLDISNELELIITIDPMEMFEKKTRTRAMQNLS